MAALSTNPFEENINSRRSVVNYLWNTDTLAYEIETVQEHSGTVSIANTVTVTGPLTDVQLRTTAVPVSGTFFQATQPVSGTFFQATQPVSGEFFQATQPVSGEFFQATQPVSGTVIADAGSNLNTSLLALESGGNLSTLAGKDFATEVTLSAIEGKDFATEATLAVIAGKDFTTEVTLAAIADKDVALESAGNLDAQRRIQELLLLENIQAKYAILLGKERTSGTSGIRDFEIR